MSSFCTAKATHIFSAKNISIFAYHDVNFNESLTNDVVSFEQLGPEWQTVQFSHLELQCFYKGRGTRRLIRVYTFLYFSQENRL